MISTGSLKILSILIAVKIEGVKSLRSIKETVCLEIPAFLASCVWLYPSLARNSLSRFRNFYQLLTSITYITLVNLTSILVKLTRIKVKTFKLIQMSAKGLRGKGIVFTRTKRAIVKGILPLHLI